MVHTKKFKELAVMSHYGTLRGMQVVSLSFAVYSKSGYMECVSRACVMYMKNAAEAVMTATSYCESGEVKNCE